jgi:hypothetical protein
MRAMMTMAIVAMTLAWPATRGWSETLNLQKTPKGPAALKAVGVNSLGSDFVSTLDVGRARAGAIKDSIVNQTLRGGTQDSGSSSDATRAGLANRKGTPNQFASTAEKPAQSFAASGLNSAAPALKAYTIKEQGLVNKLR